MKKIKHHYRLSNKKRNSYCLNTHEILITAFIYASNEKQQFPIEGAYERIKEIWYFIHSNNATFEGKSIDKYQRSLYVNPNLIGLDKNIAFFDSEYSYCGINVNRKISEMSFINGLIKWINNKLKNDFFYIEQKRKFYMFKSFLYKKKKQISI